ncbi:hypothetical protein M408DRAFT_211760 [Serendipita vermifera MAFF 305830]|uniref:Uncharacterized protein n=1 Tax=Serendipita vermifera MAFF 305830 TaxID=933852 RepID=A0A0C2WPA2_SERVB|nr:hypothetical protein M408DRAFT_211760 [Serendipita vermifera MAFF 305830]
MDERAFPKAKLDEARAFKRHDKITWDASTCRRPMPLFPCMTWTLDGPSVNHYPICSSLLRLQTLTRIIGVPPLEAASAEFHIRKPLFRKIRLL